MELENISTMLIKYSVAIQMVDSKILECYNHVEKALSLCKDEQLELMENLMKAIKILEEV